MRLAKDEELHQALYLWFVQNRGIGMPISEMILCEKAKQFNEQLHAQDATATCTRRNCYMHKTQLPHRLQ